MLEKLRVACCGHNGHQILRPLLDHPKAELAGVHDIPEDGMSEEYENIHRYSSLDEILADPGVDLVSLCSERRCEQVAHALACMEAGKHVYAEKPCALNEPDLDRLIATSKRTGRIFHEMAGTVFAQPYIAMREVIASGKLGAIVQILAQKSYPMHDRRPQDEDVDGGLTLQVGVHALRFVEHLSGLRTTEIIGYETTLGNPKPGKLRMASSFSLRLENGAVASVLSNYLNQKGSGVWGNECVRVFGTEGFVEATDGGERSRLVIADHDLGPLDTSKSVPSFHDMIFSEILEGIPMPLSLEAELHPTRMVIRAQLDARGRNHQESTFSPKGACHSSPAETRRAIVEFGKVLRSS